MLEMLKTVEKYDFNTERWTQGPSLNVARKHASSCSLDFSVYVICGTGYGYTHLNSIEKLNANDT